MRFLSAPCQLEARVRPFECTIKGLYDLGVISKAERLREVFRRLSEDPAAASADDARKLLASTLAQVEDELTDIPNVPENWQTDGRMYPPQTIAGAKWPDGQAL